MLVCYSKHIVFNVKLCLEEYDRSDLSEHFYLDFSISASSTDLTVLEAALLLSFDFDCCLMKIPSHLKFLHSGIASKQIP